MYIEWIASKGWQGGIRWGGNVNIPLNMHTWTGNLHWDGSEEPILYLYIFVVKVLQKKNKPKPVSCQQTLVGLFGCDPVLELFCFLEPQHEAQMSGWPI